MKKPAVTKDIFDKALAWLGLWGKYPPMSQCTPRQLAEIMMAAELKVSQQNGYTMQMTLPNGDSLARFMVVSNSGSWGRAGGYAEGVDANLANAITLALANMPTVVASPSALAQTAVLAKTDFSSKALAYLGLTGKYPPMHDCSREQLDKIFHAARLKISTANGYTMQMVEPDGRSLVRFMTAPKFGPWWRAGGYAEGIDFNLGNAMAAALANIPTVA